MKYFIVITLLFTLFFSSCTEPLEDSFSIEGLTPIYYTGDDITKIQSLPVQSIVKLGKIYYKHPYIFMNEVQKGIHVVDNSDPGNPQKVAFIEILGNSDISIKGERMYVDNFSDLVCLDITNILNVVEVSRVKGMYDTNANKLPENYNGYFKCVDESKGEVIGWVTANLENPKCWVAY